MYLKRLPYILLILISFFFCGEVISQQEKEVMEDTSRVGEISMLHSDIWKYKEGDQLEWADPEYNDDDWNSVRTALELDENNRPDIYLGNNSEQNIIPKTEDKELPNLDAIIWFRWKFSVPVEQRNKINGLMVVQHGASEIYLDGKLVEAFGIPSNDIESEIVYNPNQLPVPVYFNDAEEHVLAVRYSNLKAVTNFKKHALSFGGFILIISDFENYLNNFINQKRFSTIILIFLGAFFLTLGLIHFVIFIFYRKKRNNLFYSVFMLSASIFCFITYYAINLHEALASTKLFSSFGYILPIFLMAFLSILYSLFYTKLPKIFWVMLTIMTVIILLYFVGNSDLRIFIAILFSLAVFIESFRISLLAVIRRKRGARIVGSGVLYLLITIIVLIITGTLSGGNVDVSGSSIGGVIVILALILAFLSIPISMSIYLAWDISSTNKQLSNQLQEVERLSQETIRQEQEKKIILEKQNEVLEDQVEKRTQEITKQKDLVEIKNKEILDSISYAKRIQEAILPPDSVVQEELPNSFILYKPKDIVAGDFYWLEQKETKVLLAAADCTGHGVPGAMVSVVCNNALNRSVREFGLEDPGKILDKTREIVIQEFEKSLEDVKDGMDIALCSLSPFDSAHGSAKLQYAGAHNPLWIIRKGTNEVEEIKANKQPIGKFVNPTPFITHTINLKKGDVVYIFSDGYVDQFGGEKAKKFKSVNFKKLLLSIQDQPMEKQKEVIAEKFEGWKGELEQIDDVCVIGVRI